MITQRTALLCRSAYNCRSERCARFLKRAGRSTNCGAFAFGPGGRSRTCTSNKPDIPAVAVSGEADRARDKAACFCRLADEADAEARAARCACGSEVHTRNTSSARSSSAAHAAVPSAPCSTRDEALALAPPPPPPRSGDSATTLSSTEAAEGSAAASEGSKTREGCMCASTSVIDDPWCRPDGAENIRERCAGEAVRE